MKKTTSILLAICLIVSGFNMLAYAEGGYDDHYVNIDKDTLSDIIIRDFDKDYAVAYNDFENISGYRGMKGHFIIEDTNNPNYDTALSIPAIGHAIPDTSIYNGTYNWNGKTLNLFNEPLEIGEDYILSYEYWSDPDPQPVVTGDKTDYP